MAFPQYYPRAVPPIAFEGMAAYANINDESETLINAAPQVAQVATLTVSGATDAKVYTVTINGVDVSATAGVSSTTSTIATALAAAINAEPLVRGSVSASPSSATVVVTALMPGVAFTTSEADAQLSWAATTANAAAEAVPAGRAVMMTEAAQLLEERPGAMVKAAYMTAQVDTMVITYTSGSIMTVAITIEGITYRASATMASNLATAGALMATNLNAVLPAETVLASFSVDTLTLTGEVNGKGFTSKSSFAGTDGGSAVETHGETVLSNLESCMHGVSLYSNDEERVSGQSYMSYPANAGMHVLNRGAVWVALGTAIGADSSVWVGTGTGEYGLFYAASGTGRIKLPITKAKWLRRDSASGLGLLWVSFNN